MVPSVPTPLVHTGEPDAALGGVEWRDGEAYFIHAPHVQSISGQIAWSPTGTLIAGATFDLHIIQVIIWDAATGRELRRIDGHADSLTAVDWSPNGRYLATSSYDDTVRVWDVTNGRQVVRIDNQPYFSHVRWSPDGKRIATISKGAIQVWDALSGGHLMQLAAGASPSTIIWSRTGSSRITAICEEGYGRSAKPRWLRVWDAETGKLLQELDGATYFVAACCPSAPMFAGVVDDEVFVHRAVGEVPAARLSGHEARVHTISWRPDGRILATGSLDHTVRLWDPNNGRELSCLRGHTEIVTCVTWSPDGRRLASSSVDGSVRVWSSETGEEVGQVQGRAEPVTAVSWSPDGRYLAAGYVQSVVQVWNATTGEALQRWPSKMLGRVWWGGDSETVTAVDSDELLQTWSLRTGKMNSSFRAKRSSPYQPVLFPSAKLSPDREHAATIDVALSSTGIPSEGALLFSIRVWKLASGEELRRFGGFVCDWKDLSWSPDSSLVAATGPRADDEWFVGLWDVASGRELRLMPLPGKRCICKLDWSTDGASLAFASEVGDDSEDGEANCVWVWQDWQTSPKLSRVAQHRAVVTQLAFSPDSRYLASSSGDGTVRIWDMVDVRESHSIRAHSRSVDAMTWSPDSTRIASGSEDGSIRVSKIEAGQVSTELVLLASHDSWAAWRGAVSEPYRLLRSTSGDLF